MTVDLQSQKQKPYLSWYYELLIQLLAASLIFCLAYFATINVARSDSLFTLLLSQAMIEQGTIKLDAYQSLIDPKYNFDYNYRVEQVNGHYYYFYPIGTSILASPWVWIANQLGWDMTIPAHEFATQNLLSALSCVVIFVLSFRLCRCYLDFTSSLIISLVSILGSTLISTMGSALWSINSFVFIVILALLHLVRYDRKLIANPNPYWLGFLLFAAYLCRPTASLFIGSVFIYLLSKDRWAFIKVALAAFVFLMIYTGFNWLEFGRFLPTYYTPDTHLTNSSWLVGIYGNLLSPSRGLLIFSPFLILVLVGVGVFISYLRHITLFWMSVIWVLLHLFITSANSLWWGGHSFGPRLLTDIMPALILITILVWQKSKQTFTLPTQRFATVGYIFLGSLGIFINSYQGLYNPATDRWNKSPNIDTNPQYLFDWTYPQFLASPTTLETRSLEHQQAQLPLYIPGETIDFQSEKAVFWGWTEPDVNWRWTQDQASNIVFRLANNTIIPNERYVVEILGGAKTDQTVEVVLNDTSVGQFNLEAFTGTPPMPQTLSFDGQVLREDTLNDLGFRLVGGDDQQPSEEMAFVSLKIYPSLEQGAGIYFFEAEFFETGFSQAEKSWRWTDGQQAQIDYPMTIVETDRTYILELTAGALDEQEIQVFVNGTELGGMMFAGFEPQTQQLSLDGTLLISETINKIQFSIPNATSPDGDTRQLGLAFVSVKLNVAE